MIKEFYHSKERLEQIDKTGNMMEKRHKSLLNGLHCIVQGKILEADQRNPLTKKIEKKYNCIVESASGDFNWELLTPNKYYDTIISSHVIEHLVNQLTYLKNITDRLLLSGKFYLVFPQRPQFLVTNHHYYEIPHKKFILLAKEAGLKIISYEKILLMKGSYWDYTKGIRPILRFFLDKEAHYVLMKIK